MSWWLGQALEQGGVLTTNSGRSGEALRPPCPPPPPPPSFRVFLTTMGTLRLSFRFAIVCTHLPCRAYHDPQARILPGRYLSETVEKSPLAEKGSAVNGYQKVTPLQRMLPFGNIRGRGKAQLLQLLPEGLPADSQHRCRPPPLPIRELQDSADVVSLCVFPDLPQGSIRTARWERARLHRYRSNV